MCGFFGEFSNELLNVEDFRKNLQRSFKRGPDQQEIWSDGNLYQVGFNRLSILDLTENGKQPLISPSGRYSLVINGEIYNYKELQRKYNIAESRLRSTSDSEVISQLLDHLPVENLVKELNGMFAMAVYDCKLKNLTLLRDFAGIKPLYFGMVGGSVVFASQFDQIFQHPKFKNQLQVDVNGLYDYASLGYMATERTVFKNIFQLQPGELVQFDSPANRKRQQFCKFQPNASGIFEESSNSTYEKLHDILGSVVQDQLVADVPVGLFLSGGVDSPIIAAYAKKYKSDITAYTIGVSESHMDESAQAGAYAKTLNIRHEIIRFEEQELLRYNDEHFNSLTAPFGDYSSLPTYLVTQIARANNTVMLSGDGGDELFWGYPRFLNVVNHYKWFSYPISIRARGAGLLRRTGRRVSYGVSNFDKINEWVLAQQCHNSSRSLKGLMPGQTFSPELLDYYTPSNKLASKEELLQWLRWNEFYGHLQRVLAKVDLTSMGNSLEVRVPFLDKRVIDFAWQLKPGLGIHHQTPKLLLKNVLKRQLGNATVSDKKRGFTVPVRKWLRKELREDLQNHLLEIPLFGDTIWNRPELEKSLKMFFEEDKGNEWGIWILYAMQKWAKRYQLV